MGASPRFLGLSTGRAGSRYLTDLLNKVGIRTLHEQHYDPPAWRNTGALGEISAHLVVDGPEAWREAKVWHFTRHPQPFVNSLMVFGFWRMNARKIHPYLRPIGKPLIDSYRYWLEWNRRILDVSSDRRTTFRIEDISASLLQHLAETIGRKAHLNGIAPAWEERQSFAPIPEEIAPEVHAMMEGLGYAPRRS